MSKNQIVVYQPNETVGLDVRNRILTIRGVQVLLDRDLAELYGVTTGALNQAVKRNSNRFPERFMFQLSEDEFNNWKSQIVISNLPADAVRMGLRKRPFVFTEHGVAMLRREAVATSDRQLGDCGDARPFCEEAQGSEGDDNNLGAF